MSSERKKCSRRLSFSSNRKVPLANSAPGKSNSPRIRRMKKSRVKMEKKKKFRRNVTTNVENHLGTRRRSRLFDCFEEHRRMREENKSERQIVGLRDGFFKKMDVNVKNPRSKLFEVGDLYSHIICKVDSRLALEEMKKENQYQKKKKKKKTKKKKIMRTKSIEKMSTNVEEEEERKKKKREEPKIEKKEEEKLQPEEVKKIECDLKESKSLDVSQSRDEKIEATLTYISRTIHIKRLKKINLKNNRVVGGKGVVGLKIIISNPRNVIEELNLSGCRIGDEKFSILGEAMLANKKLRIKRLHLEKDRLTHKSMELLGKTLRTNRSLELIDVSDNREIGAIGFYHLAKNVILNEKSRMDSLVLHYTGDYDFSGVGDTIDNDDLGSDNKSLTSLSFHRSRILKDGAGKLAHIISKFASLKSIDLDTVGLTDEALIPLLPTFSSLEFLEKVLLQKNQLSEYGLKKLLQVQKRSRSKVWKLQIHANEGGDGFIPFLNPRRVEPDFGKMNLTDICIPSLYEFMSKTSSTHHKEEEEEQNIITSKKDFLWIYSNKITNRSGKLSLFFELPHLSLLCLSDLCLGNEGAEKLISCLEKNKTISSLYIDRIGIDGGISEKFWDALFSCSFSSESSPLSFLDLSGNELGLRGTKKMVDAILRNTSFLCRGDLLLNSIPFTIEMVREIIRILTFRNNIEFLASNRGIKVAMNACPGMDDTTLAPIFQNLHEVRSHVRRIEVEDHELTNVGYNELLKNLAENFRSAGSLFFLLSLWTSGGIMDDDVSAEPSLLEDGFIKMLGAESVVLDNINLPSDIQNEIEKRILEAASTKTKKKEIKITVTRNGTVMLSNEMLTHRDLKKVLLDGASHLKKKLVRCVDVSNNEFGDRGVPHLIQLLLVHCPHLEVLDVSECKITDSGLVQLIRCLMEKNRKIRVLKFAGNVVGRETLRMMKSAGLI